MDILPHNKTFMDNYGLRTYNTGMKYDHYCKYLTFSEEDKKWPLYCTDVGSNKTKPNAIYPPNIERHPDQFRSVATGRILNEYHIVYITEGRGTFTSEGANYTVLPGTVMLLLPNVIHAYRPDFETGWTEYWTGFQGKYARNLVKQGIISKQKPIYHVGFHNTLLSLFTSVFDDVTAQKPLYQFRAGAKIMMLIAEVLSYARIEDQHTKSHEIVEKAKHIFDSNIYGFVEIDAVATEIGIGKSHLCEIFRSYTDMTPYQYFIHAKMNKAKELLEAGNPSIKEVAFKLGFEDQYYFSRIFKKKTGVPPSQWNITLFE